MAVNCSKLCGSCLGGEWRKHSQKIFLAVYLVIAIVAFALTIWETVVTSMNSDDPVNYLWFVAGISAQLATAISFWNIFNHLVYYSKPSQQKYIVRMLGIVPAHSINCWFSIKFVKSAIYLDTIRNFYQAVVIYCFMSLLLVYLNETFDDLEKILISKPKFKPQPPCCCVKAVPNKRLIGRCRAGVLNYTILHPIITILTIITTVTGHYTEGSFIGLWIWFAIIDGVSQVWAMYCLMVFYRATKEELAGLHPISKLITVQLTIFGAFFQSFIIALVIGLSNPNLDPENWGYDDQQKLRFSRFIQDFILCIEMGLSAVGHLYAFPYTAYKDADKPANFMKSCISCCSVTDIAQDISSHVKRLSSKKPNLANQIVYEQYDEDQPNVELDDMMTIVKQGESVGDASSETRTTTASSDIAIKEEVVDVEVDDKNLDEMVAGDVANGTGLRTVRHDSGSYSTNGNSVAGKDEIDLGVGSNGTVNEPDDDGQEGGDFDLGLYTHTVRSDVTFNMEFDA
nr:transmembrane protein 184C-like [Lytechinus pictus]